MKFWIKKLRHVLIHGHPLGKIKSKEKKIIVTDTKKEQIMKSWIVLDYRKGNKKRVTIIWHLWAKERPEKEKSCNDIKLRQTHVTHRMTRV